MFSWSVQDWLQASYIAITALSVVVTGFMAYWVTNTLQRKIDNEKTLKEFYTDEIKSLRQEARKLISDYTVVGNQTAEQMKRSHYLLQYHINDLLRSLRYQYSIPKNYMKAYNSSILSILESDSEYIKSFKNQTPVTLSDANKKKLQNLEMRYDHLFNDLIMKVYGKQES